MNSPQLLPNPTLRYDHQSPDVTRQSRQATNEPHSKCSVLQVRDHPASIRGVNYGTKKSNYYTCSVAPGGGATERELPVAGLRAVEVRLPAPTWSVYSSCAVLYRWGCGALSRLWGRSSSSRPRIAAAVLALRGSPVLLRAAAQNLARHGHAMPRAREAAPCAHPAPLSNPCARPEVRQG
eukprot:2728543-Prymnesium_polylepis.1